MHFMTLRDISMAGRKNFKAHKPSMITKIKLNIFENICNIFLSLMSQHSLLYLQTIFCTMILIIMIELKNVRLLRHK